VEFHSPLCCLKKWPAEEYTVGEAFALATTHGLHAIGGFEPAVECFSTPQSRATNHGLHLDNAQFQVKAIQVDGGSEFMAEFESECARLGLALYVLPPRSPKLNGCVERLNRTFRNERVVLTNQYGRRL